jgi:hypothetical protein
MSGTPRKIFLRCLLACLLLAVGACSNLQIGYNLGDTATLYYLDGYLDLNARQEQQVSAELKQLFAWHRQNELPAYARELGKIRQMLEKPLSIAQLQDTNDFMRDALQRLALKSVPMLSQLMLSLTPQQVAYLREQLDESNALWREEQLAGSPAEQRDQRYERMLEQFEQWLGPLDAQQQATLRVSNEQWPVDQQFWYSERLIRQQEMLALIEYSVTQQPPQAQLELRLRGYILNFEKDRSVQRKVRVDSSREHVMRLIVGLTNNATAVQKQHIVLRAQDLIDDFSALVAAGD